MPSLASPLASLLSPPHTMLTLSPCRLSLSPASPPHVIPKPTTHSQTPSLCSSFLPSPLRTLQSQHVCSRLRSGAEQRGRGRQAGRRQVGGKGGAMTSAMSLPHANWSARAIKTFGMGELEARKLKYPTTGTEALLLGLLVEGTSEGARYLRSTGINLFAVREAAVSLLGKADMFFFSPEHPPLTEPAKKAFEWAIAQHGSKEGEILVELLLLGIWEQRESAGSRILSQLGFGEEQAAAVRKMVDSKAAAAAAGTLA